LQVKPEVKKEKKGSTFIPVASETLQLLKNLFPKVTGPFDGLRCTFMIGTKGGAASVRRQAKKLGRALRMGMQVAGAAEWNPNWYKHRKKIFERGGGRNPNWVSCVQNIGLTRLSKA